jgi:signal transduction histidine kinase
LITHWAERTALAERRAEQLRALAMELTLAERRERRYLAGILHDHLQQQLAAAKMHAGIVEQDLVSEPQRRLLGQVMKLLDESIATTRSLSVELSPPVMYERGLAAGLEWLAAQMREKYGLAVQVTIDPHADPSDQDLCELLFHATRELLLNVVKHAGAASARLRMTRSADRVRIEVSDQGAGFDPSALEVSRTFGLFQIRERLASIGGRTTIQSARGAGARVTISAPHDPRGVIQTIRDVAQRT